MDIFLDMAYLKTNTKANQKNLSFKNGTLNRKKENDKEDAKKKKKRHINSRKKTIYL